MTRKALVITAAAILLCTALPCFGAESIDRVVAYVGETAITLLEFKAEHEKALSENPSRKPEETLESMINTELVLQEAHKLRLAADSRQELVRKYLDLKVRSTIIIKNPEVLEYYNRNKASFGTVSLRKARPEIESYLRERRFNELAKKHLKDLREKADIMIFDLP